jgi:phosphate transport system permease protein
VPSIVIGAFGFVVMQILDMRTSLLGGIVVLAVLMIPIMTRAIEEIIKMIPVELKEISYSLGATRLETTLGVVMRQVVPGIVTALMLAFCRGIGDAASLLFTSGYTDRIPQSIFDSAASLPLAIFFQLGTPIAEVQQRAYASALILLVIILIVSITARLLSKRMSKYVVK